MHLIRSARRRRRPRLTFAPLAWLKLQYLCHMGDTEVGGFGVTSAEDLLHVQDVVTVPQDTTAVSVRFHDDGVADFFETSVDTGLTPDRFARVWLHTHPGASVRPSGTDEATFARVFGQCDWAVMAILGRTGRISARLSFFGGPGASLQLQCRVDWRSWPDQLAGGDLNDRVQAWRDEYARNVHPVPIVLPSFVGSATVAQGNRLPLAEFEPGHFDNWNGGPWDEWERF